MIGRLLLVLGLLLPACGGTSAARTSSVIPTGHDDRNALDQLDAELAKPLPDVWKDSSIALVTDPVAMCHQPEMDASVKNEASAQLEKAKAALIDIGITVQEAADNANVVFSIRILANCTGGGPPLVTGDVSAMPGNGAVAAKSDLFDISRFDAGKVTLALLRNETLVNRMQPK